MTPPITLKIRKPLGCSILDVVEHADRLELCMVEVRPKFRRQGVGTLAVARARVRAMMAGKPLQLTPVPKLVGWYQRMGFKLIAGNCMECNPEEKI